MTQKRAPDNTIAPLRNVTAFMTMLRRLQDRGMNLPGMATFSGPAGWGKTSAAVFAATSQNAIVVQCGASVNRAWLCDKISVELGITPRGTIAHKVDAIGVELSTSQRPLILDEADHLIDRKHAELAREIYERSLAPVILIGEELMPQKMRALERLSSRMLVWQQAEPCDGEDLRVLASRLIPGRSLSDEVSARLLEVCRGSLRRMATNLDGLRHHAELRGLETITAADVEDYHFYTGTAPAPRRVA